MKYALLLSILAATPLQAASYADFVDRCNPNSKNFIECFNKQVKAYYDSTPKQPIKLREASPDEQAYNMAMWHAQDNANNAVDSYNRSIDQANAINNMDSYPGINYYQAYSHARSPK